MEKPKRKQQKHHTRLDMWRKDPHCAYCRDELEFNQSTLDHIIPRSRGGSNRRQNLALACKFCNTNKSDKTVEKFRSEWTYLTYNSIV